MARSFAFGPHNDRDSDIRVSRFSVAAAVSDLLQLVDTLNSSQS